MGAPNLLLAPGAI